MPLMPRGYGIAVQPNMALIFAALGLEEAVLAGGARIDRRDSLDGDGRVLMSRPTERSPYRIDRRHVVRLLAERARAAGAEIALGSTVVDARADGTLRTEDGARAPPTWSLWPTASPRRCATRSAWSGTISGSATGRSG